jgi:hypothetical protein
VFKVGGQVRLRTKELLLDAADIGKLTPRWDGPFNRRLSREGALQTLRMAWCE